MSNSTSSDAAAAEALLAQAIQASQSDRAEEAMTLFQQAAEHAPYWAAPHLLMGAELAHLGQTDAAENAFAQAVLLDPQLEVARFQLGLLQFIGGRTLVALNTWQPLADGPPSNPLQRAVHGFALLLRTQFDDAIAAFEQAIALNQQNPALNGDLTRLIGRIREQQQRLNDELSARSDVDAQEQAQNALHVLLANYKHQGPPH